jgi:ParB family chromosome partitioning protein
LEVRQIEVKRITEDPSQPRKHHCEESLQGLADSIRQHGMLNPITVSQGSGEGFYRIITGERRWRAASMARLETIPCVIKELGDDERLTVQLIENLQREDLQPLEKGKAILHVKNTLNLTNREIARRLGLSERTIGYLIDLLALPEDIGEAVISSPNRPSDGQVTEKHARFLKALNADPDLQTAVVDRIRDEKLNTEETGNLVRALKKRPDKAKEILDSPTDHLVKFFQDSDPAGDFLNGIEVSDSPARLSPYAQRVIDFLPALSGLDIAALPMPEVRQLEDALTSLKLTVDGLLKACKTQLGG